MDGYIFILVILIAIASKCHGDDEYYDDRMCTYECERHWDPKHGNDLKSSRHSHYMNERGCCVCCEGRAGIRQLA